MDVQINELKKSSRRSSNLFEYTFSDMPIILGMILTNELRGKAYWGGNVSAEGCLDKETKDKWHDIFLSLAGQ